MRILESRKAFQDEFQFSDYDPYEQEEGKMKYRVHYEDNNQVLDFEIESDYYIADERLNKEIYDRAKTFNANPDYCKYLEVEKIESEEEDGNT